MGFSRRLAAASALAAAAVASMWAPAFTAARWAAAAPGEAQSLRKAVEASPPPSLTQAGTSGNSSGWTQLAAAGALVAAAALRAGNRRRRAVPAVNNDGVKVIAGPAVLSGAQLAAPASLGFAARGQAETSSTGRASRIVANVRTRKGMYTRWRRQDMWLKFSETYSNRRKNCFRIAKQAVMHSLKRQWRSRRLFKRERRQLWIMRVNANTRLHGIPYHKFINKMKEVNININRKILSQLGVYDRSVFTNIMDVAIPDWKEIKAEKDYVKPDYTVEQLDDLAIPYLETTIPEIYTDPTIRFNRQVRDWGVEYTIDIGTPEEWREVLPKMPELANFNFPDHMLNSGNQEHEEIPLELQLKPPTEETEPGFAKFMQRVKTVWKEEDEKKERGEPIRPRREGISRDNWFDEEPQSWF